MKKYVFATGTASTSLMFLGAMFKVMHFPGAAILLMLSIFTFCFLFLPFALYHVYQNSSPKKYKALFIVTYFVFAFVFVGALFKVLHWPGASWFLIVGVPLPLLVWLPVYLFQTRKEKKYLMVNFMGVMFGMTFLTVFSALLSVNVGYNVLLGVENQFKRNEIIIEYSEVKPLGVTQTIKQKSDELCAFVDELKEELLIKSENNPEDIQNGNIYKLDDTEIVINVLYSNENPLWELKSKIVEFKKEVEISGLACAELLSLTNEILNVENKPVGNKANETIPWEYYYFGNSRLIFALDALSRIERNVRFIEQELG